MNKEYVEAADIKFLEDMKEVIRQRRPDYGEEQIEYVAERFAEIIDTQVVEVQQLTTHKMNDETECPACHQRLNGVAGINSEEPPSDGDLSVCGYCATLLVYNGDQSLRFLTNTELLDHPDSEAIELLLSLQKQIKQHRGI